MDQGFPAMLAHNRTTRAIGFRETDFRRTPA